MTNIIVLRVTVAVVCVVCAREHKHTQKSTHSGFSTTKRGQLKDAMLYLVCNFRRVRQCSYDGLITADGQPLGYQEVCVR